MLLARYNGIDGLDKYRGKLVLVSEDEKAKAEEVYLNIDLRGSHDLDSALIEVSKLPSSCIKCLTISESVSSVPSNLKGRVFRVYKYNSLEGSTLSNPEGVIPLIELPDGFCDMREVYAIAMKHDGVRFIGGNLLEIPGINIGRFDDGKDKMSAVYNGVYDIFREVDFSSIEVKEVLPKTKSSGTIKRSSAKKSSTVSKKSTPKSRKSESFSKLFGGSGCEF